MLRRSEASVAALLKIAASERARAHAWQSPQSLILYFFSRVQRHVCAVPAAITIIDERSVHAAGNRTDPVASSKTLGATRGDACVLHIREDTRLSYARTAAITANPSRFIARHGDLT